MIMSGLCGRKQSHGKKASPRPRLFPGSRLEVKGLQGWRWQSTEAKASERGQPTGRKWLLTQRPEVPSHPARRPEPSPARPAQTLEPVIVVADEHREADIILLSQGPEQSQDCSDDYPSWLTRSPEPSVVWEVDEEEDYDGFLRVMPMNKRAEDAGCEECQASLLLFSSLGHNCKLCGNTFCEQCASYLTLVPRLGYSGMQQACRGCHIKATGNLCPRLADSRPSSPSPPSFSMSLLGSVLSLFRASWQ